MVGGAHKRSANQLPSESAIPQQFGIFPGTVQSSCLPRLDSSRCSPDVRSRFTFDATSDENATWSPDGKQIAFSSARDNMFGIYMKDFGGATTAQLFMETPGLVYQRHWTPEYLVYFATDSLNTGNIMAVPTNGDRKPFPVVATPYGEYNGIVPNNGHWLTYVSDESEAFECYVTSFPDAKRKWQISSGGGSLPRWDPRGKGIYYYGDGYFYLVEAKWDASSFAVGSTTRLFESPNMMGYQVSDDGERFLVLEDADDSNTTPLTIVTGWNAGLEGTD